MEPSLDAEQNEFFVPRVIERFNLGRRGREQKDRHFPERGDGQAIALYLGIKLAPNGSIAIFCGKKSTATSICEKAVEFIDRGIPLPLPQEFSDLREVERLHYLHVANLGTDTSASMSAEHGIFSHHGNTPHGIRLSVEHAILADLIKTTPGEEGKWFATAKDLQLYKLALQLADKSPCEPKTLIRAARDFLESEPAFSLGAAMAALRWLNEGWGYEVTGMDVVEAYDLALAAAERSHIDNVSDQICALLDRTHGDGNTFVRQFLSGRM